MNHYGKSIWKYAWQKFQKTNVMLFHSKFYYFHQFVVKKNWQSLDLGFVILLNNEFLSFFCKLLQGNIMIGCRVMTKMQRPLIAMNFSLLLLSLFRIIKKREKLIKCYLLICFLFTYSCVNWEYVTKLGWQSFFPSKLGNKYD